MEAVLLRSSAALPAVVCFGRCLSCFVSLFSVSFMLVSWVIRRILFVSPVGFPTDASGQSGVPFVRAVSTCHA